MASPLRKSTAKMKRLFSTFQDHKNAFMNNVSLFSFTFISYCIHTDTGRFSQFYYYHSISIILANRFSDPMAGKSTWDKGRYWDGADLSRAHSHVIMGKKLIQLNCCNQSTQRKLIHIELGQKLILVKVRDVRPKYYSLDHCLQFEITSNLLLHC